MPAIVRQGDVHVGHASPTPSPFHQTPYPGGSPNVFVNGKAVQRIGDSTVYWRSSGLVLVRYSQTVLQYTELVTQQVDMGVGCLTQQHLVHQMYLQMM